jgi:hypothetical protein
MKSPVGDTTRASNYFPNDPQEGLPHHASVSIAPPFFDFLSPYQAKMPMAPAGIAEAIA